MNDLEKLKKLADSQIKDKARIEGRIESLMEELNTEGFKTGPEAIKAMKILKKKIDKMESTLKDKINTFKDKYATELSKVA